MRSRPPRWCGSTSERNQQGPGCPPRRKEYLRSQFWERLALPALRLGPLRHRRRHTGLLHGRSPRRLPEPSAPARHPAHVGLPPRLDQGRLGGEDQRVSETERDRGATLVLIALAMPVLILMTSFAVDPGRQRSLRRVPQAAADVVSPDQVRISADPDAAPEIGRAYGRARVCQYM